MRIGTWILPISHNRCCPFNKIHGLLTTAEIAEHEFFWIKREQKEGISDTDFIVHQEQLNLQKSKHGVLKC